MSIKAFDTQTQKDVNANDCTASQAVPKGRYICSFCHSYGTDVPVFIRRKDGQNTFVSYNVTDHLNNCDFPTDHKYVNAYSPTFTPDKLFDRLIVSNSTGYTANAVTSNNRTALKHSNKPTLKWLYKVCISNRINFQFSDGYMVQDVCLMPKTLGYWFKKDKTQYPLLIIGKIERYDKAKLTINLSIGKFEIKIHFIEERTMQDFLNDCYTAHGLTVGTEIFLFGKLCCDEGFFKVEILSRKQIEIAS